MPTPISDSLASVLRSDSTAALAALMIIATAHREIFAWAARMLGGEPLVRTEEAAKQPRSSQNGTASQAARKPKGSAAYHARRRKARDHDDQALIETMRTNPEGSIGHWAATIRKGRSSVVSALKRLRDAGLAGSVEGKWKLTEEPAPREPPPRWTAPLSATQRTHAGLTRTPEPVDQTYPIEYSPACSRCADRRSSTIG
jgi:hypothetical protein